MSEKLPMAGRPGPDEPVDPAGTSPAGASTETEGGDGPRGPALDQIPAWRLITTLTVAGALAGLLIVSVFQWASPRIEAHAAERLRDAVEEVLRDPHRYERLWVTGDGLVDELPPGADSTALERVFLGFDEAGHPVGFAVTGGKPGFQDVIELIFGYDPASGELLGMKVLESKETPGLGDKIEKDSLFVGAFEGVAVPIRGVKQGAGAGEENEIDMITGATISSRTVIDIINQRLEQVGPFLRDYPVRSAAEPSAAEARSAGMVAESGGGGR